MDNRTNLFELETVRSELIEQTLNTHSVNRKIFLYQKYFDKVISLNNQNFDEAFLQEFLDDYIESISKLEASGIDPEETNLILKQIKKLSTLSIAEEYLPSLNFVSERIENEITQLNLVLNGKDVEEIKQHKAFFPLIDNETPNGFYGILESVTVRINKTENSDKFIIIPSEKEIEKKILEQCKKSWIVALDLSREYIKKPYQYHEVIISFDKKQGFYEGNSLGIALTLSFLEQILKFYNPVYVINIREHSAFTGGVTETGEVLCTSEEIIKRKVAAVFFSEINSFVFPKCEETYAYFALTQLKKSYPDRKLKLIPVEGINDVLNRRDVVEIKKQKLVIRSEKFIKKNWISAVATVLLAMLFAYLFVMDWDDNPVMLSSDGTTLFIKNKNGKVLWTKGVSFDIRKIVQPKEIFRLAKIVDINSDGQNEFILAGEKGEAFRNNNNSIIRCYDKKQNIIWEFTFQDKVYSKREILNTEYSICLLDTLTFSGFKSLFLFSSNEQSFSSAVYRIDIRTGKRLPGTFWSSGHVMDGIIKDLDNDGKQDLAGVGYENGYEDFVFFAYEIDTLTKVRPTKKEYLIRDYPSAEMKSYIRFPKTDFDNYYKARIPGYVTNSLTQLDKNSKFIFATSFPNNFEEFEIGYEINYDFKNINIVIASGFRVQRDTLVAHEILRLPYSDTEEYKNIIKNQILYWKDGKWVKREELDK